ncbi:sensor histidine kinase [Portibacter lacus]|uniref:Histidine kinase n=1 Tax=Portibacter lacus TaxID=1099794 RepID=A0AA37SPG0_9BACT|nr:histidine kinase [Portibacter lacus]GLR18488.1 histidine kinase [Portibacter lacus]
MIAISNRNFWIAQTVGWGLLGIANFLLQYYTLGLFKQAIINSIIAFAAGFITTTIYRSIIKKVDLNLMNIGRTIIIIIGSTLLLILVILIGISIIMYFMHDRKFLSINEVLGNSFTFGTLMLIWNSLYFMIHYLHNWKNAESERWKLEAAVKEAELGNLKAQINPHFMFNAINNIRALISEDADKAKEMLLHFSDMFRYSLVYNDKSLVELGDEIEIVKKYLELLSIQFEEKLSYTFEIEVSLEEVRIPPMMIQLLVENAIKHGISELPNGGEVIIGARSEGDKIILTVKNTGTLNGKQTIQKKIGVGMKNIRERLNLIYGNKAHLTLEEESGFVIAILTLPKTNKE